MYLDLKHVSFVKFRKEMAEKSLIPRLLLYPSLPSRALKCAWLTSRHFITSYVKVPYENSSSRNEALAQF